jgi:hypothetical protein
MLNNGWRDQISAPVESSILALDGPLDRLNLHNTFASLAILGGHIEGLRVGGRAVYLGQECSITNIVWDSEKPKPKPNPAGIEEKAKDILNPSLVHTLRMQSDSGEITDLTGNLA